MRIGIVSVNYEPEKSGIAPYTTGLARGLAARGHEVEVYTSLPHYPEWRVDPAYRSMSGKQHVHDGVVVRRSSHYVPRRPNTINRIPFEATFGARVLAREWNSPDVVLSTSPALIASAMVIAKARAMGVPVGLIVQDLYCRGVVETEAMSGMAARAAAYFERRVLNAATGSAVVHERFLAAAAAVGVNTERLTVIRNWAHLDPPADVDPVTVRRRHGWSPDERIVVHSGNMGAKQGLENVVAAARSADERGTNIRFVLLGDGNQRGYLEGLARDVRRIEFKDPVDSDEYRQILAAADVLLVNERPGVGEMAVPSKLTSYFSAGRAILAAAESGGVTAQEVRDGGAGVIVAAGDPTALLDAAVALADESDLRERLGQAGRDYARRLLGVERALDEYEAWCTRLVEGHRRHRTPPNFVSRARISSRRTP